MLAEWCLLFLALWTPATPNSEYFPFLVTPLLDKDFWSGHCSSPSSWGSANALGNVLRDTYGYGIASLAPSLLSFSVFQKEN